MDLTEFSDRFERRFEPLHLDPGTAERIVAGRVPPDDAPPRYRDVAALIAALQAEPTRRELADRTAVVEAMTTIRQPAPTATPSRSTGRTKLATLMAAMAASVVALGGLAAAGTLPGAAQHIAAQVLGSVGVDVPGSNDHSSPASDTRGNSDDNPGTGAPEASTGDKGTELSATARSTSESGVDKGTTVSTLASNDTSKSGESGKPSDEPSAATPDPSKKPTDPSSEKPDKSAGAVDPPKPGNDGADNRLADGDANVVNPNRTKP